MDPLSRDKRRLKYHGLSFSACWNTIGPLSRHTGGAVVTVMAGNGDKSVAEAIENEDSTPIDVVRTLATADSLMRSGRPREAMELYQLIAEASKPVEPLESISRSTQTKIYDNAARTTYSLGLCAEQVGDIETAIDR